MLVLGVDPGLNATGYGLIDGDAGHIHMVESGVIRSDAKDPIEKRVSSIFEGILEILDEFRPEMIALEDLYSHYKHPKTAIIMAHARGAVLAAAGWRKIPVHSYAATMIKISLTGNGRARKEQVQRMVLDTLGLKGRYTPYDTTDALAAALCHVSQKLRIMIS